MLAHLVPGPLVRWFARPYVAGSSLEEVLRVAARRLEARGTLATLDLLGEAVERPEQVTANFEAYERLIAAVGSDQRFSDPKTRPSVSVKPSAFTAGAQAEAGPQLEDLAEQAKAHGVALTLDMEDHPWTDATLDWSIDLHQRGFDVGAVLQTRLHRTEADLERIPAGMRVRLVIGIYPEPEEIALTKKRPMKERMVDYAARLLERGAYVEFATHDEIYLEQFLRQVAPTAPDRCEIQMLLGVPRRDFANRLREGHYGTVLPLRLYMPFTIDWDNATAYLRRRMAESPGISWLVLRNLFGKR